VTDDELEVAGVLGPKCAKIYFDDNMLKKQVHTSFQSNQNDLHEDEVQTLSSQFFPVPRIL